jgi:hypothetical protein
MMMRPIVIGIYIAVKLTYVIAKLTYVAVKLIYVIAKLTYVRFKCI